MTQSAVRIGTRGSRLALAQAEMVARALYLAETASEIVPIKTGGDRLADRSLADAGGKGLFTKELEEALISGRIDIAVHSMKDVPVMLPPGLAIGAVLKRENPADVVVSNLAPSLAALPAGARVGTGSVRRIAQLKRARPDLVAVPLRGNVDTRLAKLDQGGIEAIILALAGLKRLGLEGRVGEILPTDEWLPSPAQAAVGIELRAADARTAAAVAALDDQAAALALACERAFQAALDGSCKTPIAGLAVWDEGWLRFRGEVLAPDGSNAVATEFGRVYIGCGKIEAARAGREAGAALRPRAERWLAA